MAFASGKEEDASALSHSPAAPPPSAALTSLLRPSKAKPSKRLSTWHSSVEEQQFAQQAQREVVSARDRPGRPQTIIPVWPPLPNGTSRRWEVTCDERLYRLGPPPVDRCTPGPSTTNPNNNNGVPCVRMVRDGFLDAHEQERMIEVVEGSMRKLFHQGAVTSFAPDADSAIKQMGPDGHALFHSISKRVRSQLEADFNVDKLYPAGTLFTRVWAEHVIPDDQMDVSPNHKYDNAHVDKANRASYDYSALLYLNSHCSWASAVAQSDGERSSDETSGGGAEGDAMAPRGCAYADRAQPDFDGGRFAWLGETSDLVVEPRAGRLISFTGGLENPHGLRKVLAGTRYVIGFWFTCHAEHEYRDESRDGQEDADTAAASRRLESAFESAALEPPPVPKRRTRPASAGETTPPPVPARKRSPKTVDGAKATQQPPPVPRRKSKSTTAAEGGGPTYAQCLRQSDGAQRLLEHEAAESGRGTPRPGSLASELQQSKLAPPPPRAQEEEAHLVELVEEQMANLAGVAASAAAAHAKAEPRRYINGTDSAAAAAVAAAAASAARRRAVDYRYVASHPKSQSKCRGYDLPSHPDCTAAPFEEGYTGGYGLDGSSSMEESMDAFAKAIEAYDALHGPPKEAADDEAYLKRQRHELGYDFAPLYQEGYDGADLHPTAEAAWAALVARGKMRVPLGGGPVVDADEPPYGDEGDAATPRHRIAMDTTGQQLQQQQHQASASGVGRKTKADCGYPGITKEECEAERRCAWDDSVRDEPWCFYAM